MKLDMDKYLAAMTPPTLVLNGVEYRGTALLKFHDAVRLQQALSADATGGNILAVAQELCSLVGIPGDVVVQLPGAALMKVVAGFFESANQPPEGTE